MPSEDQTDLEQEYLDYLAEVIRFVLKEKGGIAKVLSSTNTNNTLKDTFHNFLVRVRKDGKRMSPRLWHLNSLLDGLMHRFCV